MAIPPRDKSFQGLLKDHDFRIALVERRLGSGGFGGSSGGAIAGLISPFAGGAVPNGWLLCDGKAVSRTSLPALFAAIGTTWGAGDGSTTFNVPDLRGRTLFGRDPSQAEFDVLGEAGGAKAHRHDFKFGLFDKQWTAAGSLAAMETKDQLDANNKMGAFRYSTGKFSGAQTGNPATSPSLLAYNAVLGTTNASAQLGRMESTGDTDVPTGTTGLPPYVVTNYIISTGLGSGVGSGGGGGGGNSGTPINYYDDGTTAPLRGMVTVIDGDIWYLANARYTNGEFYRIDRTHAAYGLSMQGQGYIPGEPELGYNVSGWTLWSASPQPYDLIRGGGTMAGERYAAVGGWELGLVVTGERQMTIGGAAIEVDGYGTFPFGRFAHATTGTVMHKRITGQMRNSYAILDDADDRAQDSWYWGYVEDYTATAGNPIVAGSDRWSIAVIPKNTMPASGVFDEQFIVHRDGRVEMPHSEKFGEAFFNGDGTTKTFFITHGLGAAPTSVQLTPMNAASVGAWYTKDATLIGVNFATAPASGATVAVGWLAKR